MRQKVFVSLICVFLLSISTAFAGTYTELKIARGIIWFKNGSTFAEMPLSKVIKTEFDYDHISRAHLLGYVMVPKYFNSATGPQCRPPSLKYRFWCDVVGAMIEDAIKDKVYLEKNNSNSGDYLFSLDASGKIREFMPYDGRLSLEMQNTLKQELEKIIFPDVPCELTYPQLLSMRIERGQGVALQIDVRDYPYYRPSGSAWRRTPKEKPIFKL